MKYIYPIVFSALSFLASDLKAQAPFWTETFSNSCTVGCTTYTGPNGTWTVTSTGINNSGANIWYFSCAENGNAAGTCGTGCGTDQSLHIANSGVSTSAAFFCPVGDCGAAYDDSSPAEMTNKRVESPTINCSGYSDINVSFNYIENGQTTSDDASLWYFDGSLWLLLSNTPKTNNATCGGFGVGLWTAFSIQLPASANNNPNVKIGFNWTNNGDGNGTDPSIAVDDITLSVATVGISDWAFNENYIRIYPSPVMDILKISNSFHQNLNYSVYDITGKLVIGSKQSENSLIEVNTSTLEKGIYFLLLNTETQTKTYKIIKQ